MQASLRYKDEKERSGRDRRKKEKRPTTKQDQQLTVDDDNADEDEVMVKNAAPGARSFAGKRWGVTKNNKLDGLKIEAPTSSSRLSSSLLDSTYRRRQA
jgi:hypothetical protein